MKIFIGLIIGAFFVSIGFAVAHDMQAYEKKRQFIQDCAAKGGIYSEAVTGFTERTFLCGGISSTTTVTH